ncbi:MAG: retropepsin-like aspartic protease family protein [bacterium]
MLKKVLILASSLAPHLGMADGLSTKVSMTEKASSTFYVAGSLNGYGKIDMLVDTGASFTSISEPILEEMVSRGEASHTGEIKARLANGEICDVSIYRISSLMIGDSCEVRNIEVVSSEGNTNLLGLSALRHAAPFTFSMEPAELLLSNCDTHLARK